MCDTIKIQTINRHRMGTDGEGVTSLIAMYGCPLNCKYCINKKLLKEHTFDAIKIDELIDTLMIDYCYFVMTGGGITFGGGEPLLQSKAIKEMCEQLSTGIKVNIETSLNVDKHNLLDVVDLVDLLIIDIKSMNPVIYKEYTGKDIDKLINNLNYLVEHKLQQKCLIRVPNIPNYTTKKDVDNTIDIIKHLGFNNIDAFDYIIKEEAEESKKQ